MQNLKTQFLVQLVILLVILSFPAIAGTNGKLQDAFQESNQQAKQKIDHTGNNTQEETENEAIKESSLGKLRNLQILVHNRQKKNAELVQIFQRAGWTR